MKIDTFANRLQIALFLNNMKQSDLVKKTNIDKTLLNKYIKGVSETSNEKLALLAENLNVNEMWLLGYDVPPERELKVEPKDELERFFLENSLYLTDEDKKAIRKIVEESLNRQ